MLTGRSAGTGAGTGLANVRARGSSAERVKEVRILATFWVV